MYTYIVIFILSTIFHFYCLLYEKKDSTVRNWDHLLLSPVRYLDPWFAPICNVSDILL